MYGFFSWKHSKKIMIFLQITYAKRKKEVGEKRTLHFSKCQELANYYLGFNGWSVTMKYVSVESNHINNFVENLILCRYVYLHIFKLHIFDLVIDNQKPKVFEFETFLVFDLYHITWQCMYNIETFSALHTVSYIPYIHYHTESSVRGTIRRGRTGKL